VAWLQTPVVHALPRALAPDDYYQLLDVSDPQLSPDGSMIAYVVTRNDRTADAAKSTVWMVDWDGKERRPLTQDGASQPRFSPDGRYLSFLAARPTDAPAQLWLLDLHGGEARQMTHAGGEIASYAWAPDGSRLVLVMSKGEADAAKSPQPIVIDDYHFKQDEEGYLNVGARKHLYLIDVASGVQTALTTAADFDDDDAAWAPDGKLLAYVSNHAKEAQRSGIDEIYLLEPRAGAVPRKLAAAFSPNHQHLAFSPDGRFVSFLQGREPRLNAYMDDRLAVVAVATGAVRPLTDPLDQQVSAPAFSADGASIDFIVEDHGAARETRAVLASGKISQVSPDRITVLGQSLAAGHTVILGTTDSQPPELFALEAGELRPLTTHNAPLLADLELGSVQDTTFKSRDGTDIQGQIVKPPGYLAGRRYPTILWIHGGPNGQDQHELIASGYSPSLERQLFAAQGYVVLAVNYRGSTGRGQKFQQSILGDWGHLEVDDLLAAVDHAVAQGIADPARLGIGGWSYGGILTDYTIARDPRFKAAISGAGSGNQTGMYGLDEYALQYNAELGPPWKSQALYVKLSYPFFHADRIRTPTLFMGGDKDFNVPIAGSEQMYLALRTLGVPTELVVYPGEYHVFTRPSFLKDRAERYIAWYGKYLKNVPVEVTRGTRPEQPPE
jgi:dipeptidyl aminopeptidase/acylaminoacyl peptidase